MKRTSVIGALLIACLAVINFNFESKAQDIGPLVLVKKPEPTAPTTSDPGSGFKINSTGFKVLGYRDEFPSPLPHKDFGIANPQPVSIRMYAVEMWYTNHPDFQSAASNDVRMAREGTITNSPDYINGYILQPRHIWQPSSGGYTNKTVWIIVEVRTTKAGSLFNPNWLAIDWSSSDSGSSLSKSNSFRGTPPTIYTERWTGELSDGTNTTLVTSGRVDDTPVTAFYALISGSKFFVTPSVSDVSDYVNFFYDFLLKARVRMIDDDGNVVAESRKTFYTKGLSFSGPASPRMTYIDHTKVKLSITGGNTNDSFVILRTPDVTVASPIWTPVGTGCSQDEIAYPNIGWKSYFRFLMQ